MVIKIDLENGTESLEVQLGYLCNHLERGNKAVNSEIENLLSFAHGGIIFGTSENNQKQIERICYNCKTLLDSQKQLISVIEPTLQHLNLDLKRGNTE